MTDLDLDAIRARADRVETWLDTEPGGAGRNEAQELVEDDIPVLLAELNRLRAELDPDTHGDTEPWAQRLFKQWDAAIAEIGSDAGRILSLLRYLDEARAEVARLRFALGRWESGRRRKSLPTVKSVPDGLTYAAALARAQGTEGGDDHDQLLAEAAQRLKALNDAASALLAEAVVLRAELDLRRDEVARLRAEADEWTVELPPSIAEILRAARAWREARRGMPTKPGPSAAALVAAVDAAWPDGAA